MQAGGIAGSSSDLVSDRDREEAEAGLEERSVFLYVLGGFTDGKLLSFSRVTYIQACTYLHGETERWRDKQTHKQKSKTENKTKYGDL